MKIDGSEISLYWTKNKTESAIDKVKVVKATSSTFTVNKPFFKLSFYNGNQWIEYDFSMYDIENAPTSVSADAITIDGSASSIAEFSNYLGTKSVDGSLKVTWSLGRHSYSKTVKNVYNASYVRGWMQLVMLLRRMPGVRLQLLSVTEVKSTARYQQHSPVLFRTHSCRQLAVSLWQIKQTHQSPLVGIKCLFRIRVVSEYRLSPVLPVRVLQSSVLS